MKIKNVVFLIFGVLIFLHHINGQTDWRHTRSGVNQDDDVETYYTSAAHLPNGNSILGGFIANDSDNGYTLSSLLTLVDAQGKVIRDSVFSTFDDLAIVHLANIPGTNQFYSLMSGYNNPTLVTMRWSEDFTFQIIDEVNFQTGLSNSDFVFKYRKNVDGNLLFHSNLESLNSDWLLVFEVNSMGSILSAKIVEDLYCSCLIQKIDKSGFYCIDEEHLVLDNNFVPTKQLEIPLIDLDYFGIDAEYVGDTIILSANILNENEDPIPVLFSFNQDMELLDSIHLIKENLYEGFVFKSLAISENKQIMHVTGITLSDFSGNEYLLSVTNSSFTNLKQYSLDTQPGEILGVSISFNEPDHLYICISNEIDANEDTYVPTVIKMLSSVLSTSKEFSLVPEFRISPNPVFEEIRLPEFFPGQQAYKILHQNGTVVKEGSLLPDGISTISVNGISSGYYLLLVSDQQKVIGKSAFVKM